MDEAWAALNNPETVAPCFPGATLESYESDAFTGTVKVKLGPISLTYKGKGTYVSRDDAKHEVVIDASGRDARGNGTANAKVTGTMQADGPDKTEVTMVTDLTITGRPAQFGRGVISDVSEKIIGQFASCLTEKLGEKAPAAAQAPTAGAEAKPAETKPAGPVRSDVEAIDLLDTAGAPVLKRLAPVIGGALLLLIILLIRRSRSR
ncbi:SRPBCC family protein [Pseudonocardia hispaniensis]|uniref:SRPBCC family protein n=1 Tax=Pseudonocardia hispaniensis TaxID=904933 RepID=A0ABW1J3R3_9PSEU